MVAFKTAHLSTGYKSYRRNALDKVSSEYRLSNAIAIIVVSFHARAIHHFLIA